jgi:hypothetical protein
MEHFAAGRIATLAQHEVNPGLEPGSRDNYLYFTLPVCINFQRSSPAMWQAALATYEDAQTRYLFYPEQLEDRPYEQIQADLLKHKLGLQPNKHTLIWTTIAHTLYTHFASDPRQVVVAAGYDAGKLIRLLQVERRKDFPFLSGPKLSNYWPFILSQFTDAMFANAHEISIIPDTHVIQSSVQLGLVPAGASAAQAEAAWRELLAGSGINPVEVHPVLWNWSRNGFRPEV